MVIGDAQGRHLEEVGEAEAPCSLCSEWGPFGDLVEIPSLTSMQWFNPSVTLVHTPRYSTTVYTAVTF